MAITDTREQIIAKRGYRSDIHGAQYILYLSNYPIAATYLATRLKGDVLLELCCGLGVTLEALAPNFNKLIGIDIDQQVIDDCEQNLQQAGVIEKANLINGNISDKNLLKSLKADVVIYDIPYWFPKKLSDGTEALDKNPNLIEIVGNIREFITQNIVLFAPPYMEYDYFLSQIGECEYEQIYINGKYDRNYIYFGNVVRTLGKTQINLTQ